MKVMETRRDFALPMMQGRDGVDAQRPGTLATAPSESNRLPAMAGWHDSSILLVIGAVAAVEVTIVVAWLAGLGGS